MRCDEIFDVLSMAWDGDLPAAVRRRVEPHLVECPACREDVRELRSLGGAIGRLRRDLKDEDEKASLPGNLEARLRGLARWHCRTPHSSATSPLPFGIRGDFVSPGDHVAYFWESEEEFDRAAGFLEAGIGGGEHGIVFGHEEANERVVAALRGRALDPERLRREKRLSVLGGSPKGEALMETAGGCVSAALAGGAPRVRLLGNLGWGRQGWPPDEEILDFEAKVTDVARTLPLVVVCMYDVAGLPGKLLLKGGFETHPHTWRRDALRRNEHFAAA